MTRTLKVDVEQVKKDYKAGMPITELRKKHNISHGYIYHYLPRWGVSLRGQEGRDPTRQGGRPPKKAETPKTPPPRTARSSKGVYKILEKEEGVLYRRRISDLEEAVADKTTEVGEREMELKQAQEHGTPKGASDVAAEIKKAEAELRDLEEELATLKERKSPFSEAAKRRSRSSVRKPVDVREHTRRR